MKLLNVVLAACCVAAAGGCGGEGAADATVYPVRISRPHFEFALHRGVSKDVIDPIYDSLMARYESIKTRLQVSAMPVITISLWADSHEFFRRMEQSLGTAYNADGYMNGYTEMCMLYSSRVPGNAVHEYAHLVSLALNSAFSNNPRWLWEGVAIYESGEVSTPATWSAEERVFPGFNRLNEYNSPLPYRWGYVLVEFIHHQWGYGAYIRLIRANGNLRTVLNVDEGQFESLLNEYLGTR